MKKEEIRKEFFKLKIKGNSYAVCIRVLKAQFGFDVSERTLQRWSRKLEKGEWDLRNVSTRPKTIHKKITFEIESEVIKIRKETGWEKERLLTIVKYLIHLLIEF